jgi:hypothetical protein
MPIKVERVRAMLVASGRPYKANARRSAVEYANGRRRAGAGFTAIGRELGVSPMTVEAWLASAALDWRGARHHLSADGGCVSYWSESRLVTLLAVPSRPREHALSPVAVTPVLRQSRAMSWAFGDDFAVPNVSD